MRGYLNYGKMKYMSVLPMSKYRIDQYILKVYLQVRFTLSRVHFTAFEYISACKYDFLFNTFTYANSVFEEI